tara:strand:- start:1516 stop:2181 length:666 start_codon:yes stop_codon:yes gene_type:complete
MVEMSETIGSISKALVGAQADVGKALKNQENSHFKSSYADLSSVLEVAKPALAKHGLALTQFPGEGEGTVTMSTLLLHESGEWILLPPASIPLQANTAHGYGSAISYLRRYTTQAALGISVGISDDDDGNEATAQAPKKAAKKKASKPVFPPATDGEVQKALDVLTLLIAECEAVGTVEARHIALARTVVQKRGVGAKGKSPIERIKSATLYLGNLVNEAP